MRALGQAKWPWAPLHLRLAPHAVLAAFAGGLIGALAIAPPVAWTASGALGAAVAAMSAIRARWASRALAGVAVAALLAGWALGTARLVDTAPPRLVLPAAVSGTVVVDAPPVPWGAGGVRARVVVERLAAADRPLPPGTRLMLVNHEAADAGSLRAGVRLQVRGRIAEAAGQGSPGWWRAYLARERIAARLSVARVRSAGRRGGLRGLRDRWRNWAGENAGAGLRGEHRAIVTGLALGGGDTLSERTAEDFRDAGIWHLLAVSGQNVTVVALFALALLRALGLARRPAVIGALVALVAYCLACDGGPSVGRAGVVGALGLLGELRSAGRDRWYLLLAGLAALLAVDPRSAADPGLQLSFSAVVGLFVLAEPFSERLAGWLPVPVAGLAGLAGAAGLATAPVVVWHFGRLSLAGLVVNVAAVPLAAPVVVLALLGLGVGTVLPPLGVALNWVAGLGATALMVLARTAAAVPGAALDLPRWAAAPLAGLVLAPGLIGRAFARVGMGRPGPRPAVVMLVLVPALAVLGWTRPWRSEAAWPAQPTATVLDVGQGDAILLRSPEGAAALVDAGPPGHPAPVVAALRRSGVGALGLLVLTHGSRDHAGGASALIEAGRVALLAHPALGDEEGDGAASARMARSRGVATRLLAAGDRLTVGEWRLRVLWPERGASSRGDPNPRSLVVHAAARGASLLLTADAESPTLLALSLPPVSVLKVAHHGSDDPGLPRLLGRLRPRGAVISAGGGNPFGHPTGGTLDALRSAAVPTWRTDRGGDVELAVVAGRLSVDRP